MDQQRGYRGRAISFMEERERERERETNSRLFLRFHFQRERGLGIFNRRGETMSATGSNGQQKRQQNDAVKPALRKPVFTKVDQLKPGTSGHTLVAKVLSANAELKRGRPVSQSLRNTRIAECLIGDETGAIIFTARNDQVDIMKASTTVILRNAKIDMFKGTMRLAVDKWGRIEVTEAAKFTVKEDNNLSMVEYELVKVADEGP